MKTTTLYATNLRTGPRQIKIPADAQKQKNETTAAFIKRVEIKGDST